MIELVFVACLVADPDHCEGKTLLYNGVTPMTCMIQSQSMMAQWKEQHIKWFISEDHHFSCRVPNMRRTV